MEPRVGGLWESLVAVWRVYGLEAFGLEQRARVVLPVRDALVKMWDDKRTTGTLAGTSTALVTVHTVPSNERWWLYEWHLIRNGGDNTLWTLAIYPNSSEYQSGSLEPHYLKRTGSSLGSLYQYEPSSPLQLEPGMLLQMGMSGAGTTPGGDGTWDSLVYVAKMKIR